MNKSEKKKSNRINIKKERLIVSYLYIIISIFGIIFYTFFIVDGFGFLVSIINLIIGVSLTILLLKGKLSYLKKSKDNNIYLIGSILEYMVCVATFYLFILDPYGNALWLIVSLIWLGIAIFQTLLYVKLHKI